MTDVTVTITFYREGTLAVPSLASAAHLVAVTRASGISVEAIAVLDCSDEQTRRIVAAKGAWLDKIMEVDCDDLSMTRNFCAQSAAGKYLAFLDGDDLWGADWLRLAYIAATSATSLGDVIWHPEILYLFAETDLDRTFAGSAPLSAAKSEFVVQRSSDDPDFDRNALLLTNLWSANAFASRELHLRYPYKAYDRKKGFGIEDWSWNLETIFSGIPHRIVPGSVHLIRLKDQGSLNAKNELDGLLPFLPIAALRPSVVVPPLTFWSPNGVSSPSAIDDEIEPWPADRPLVSVVIVSFNYGRFVSKAVESVLAQTFADLEVIVVEGGSTDADSRRQTLAIDRPRTRVIAQNGPHPVGANRNFGISHARGKYCCCLDADDMLLPTYIEKCVFLMESCGYDVVGSALQYFGNLHQRNDVMESPTFADLLKDNQMRPCAMFRRSLWRRSGGYQDADPGITGIIYEDWLFWAQLAGLGAKIHNMARDHLFLYRSHGPSLSNRAEKMYASEVHRELIRRAVAERLDPDRSAHRDPDIADLRAVEASFEILARGRSIATGLKTILLALPSTIMDGLEQYFDAIAGRLADSGWRVIVTTSIDPGKENYDIADQFKSVRSEVYHLPRFLAQPRWGTFVRYLMASRQVDVLWIAGSAFMYDQLLDLRAEFPKLRFAETLLTERDCLARRREFAAVMDMTFVQSPLMLRTLRKGGELQDKLALVPFGEATMLAQYEQRLGALAGRDP
jgi:glycosyltransferase involved in cell wall biosynthesis